MAAGLKTGWFLEETAEGWRVGHEGDQVTFLERQKGGMRHFKHVQHAVRCLADDIGISEFTVKAQSRQA